MDLQSAKLDCGLHAAASAAFHKSSRIMLAAVKFFLGQDEAADNSDEVSDEDTIRAVNPSKEEIYNASKKAGLFPVPRIRHSFASDKMQMLTQQVI